MLAAARRIIARLAPVAALCLWAINGLAAAPVRLDERAPDLPAEQAQAAEKDPLSPIEAAFSARAGTVLRLFGRDLFAGAAAPSASGAVQGDHILGTGDELTVVVRGSSPFEGRYRVSHEGLLLLPELPPLAAAGRSLAEVRRQAQEALVARRIDGEAYIYLTDARRISVLALGAMARPGRVDASAFATVLDALLLAGGVRPDGSLRAIRLHRDGAVHDIDLYRLLLRDGGNDAGNDGDSDGGAMRRLRDGDRLLTPPVGPTVGLAGPVKRPGIFELPPDRPLISLRDLLKLAGGPLRPADHRALRLSIAASGQERAEELSDDGALLRDGDLVLLRPQREDRRGVAHLDGHVLRPGPRAVAEAKTLGGLLAARDLPDDAWTAFAAVASPGPEGGAPVLSAVDLAALLRGRGGEGRALRNDNRALRDGERLIVLGAADVDYLTSAAVLALLRGEPAAVTAADRAACPGLETLARALAADPRGPLANGPQARVAATLTGPALPCPAVFRRYPDLLTFALTQSVLRRGGATRPGFYPVAGSDAAGRGEVVEEEAARVELIGHVRHPGSRPLARAASLRALLDRGRALEPGVYPLAGVIERFDPQDRARRLLAFSPAAAAGGANGDMRLNDRDRVHVFSAARIRAMLDPAAPGKAEESIADGHMMEPPDPALRAFLAERTVQVRGAVLAPAALPVAGPTPVAALLDAAGGLSPQADVAAIEITQTAAGAGRRRVTTLEEATRGNLMVEPGGAVRVNPRPAAAETGAVLLEGEVRRPGHYDILRGEKLSSLLARAGGLTDEAYPAGTVFLRDSARRREKAALEEQARTLERNIALLLQKGENVRQEDVALARQLAAQLRGVEPPGRIVAEADPVLLARHPDRDTLMESGDRISIPKRPLTVAVTGEVMAAGSYPFETGKDAADYLRDAGGVSGMADESRAFVLLPDGRARPLSISFWNHQPSTIPPGATLVVPADPRPYGGRELVQSVADVLAKIALTAASISVISR